VRQLLRQATHLFAGMLWAASVLALLAGMPALAAAIVLVIVVNAVFAFWQEHRADRAAVRLRSLVPARARVRRDGTPTTVAVEDVVVGDVVLLAAGDRVCADLEVRDASALRVDESLLTGESAVAHRRPGDLVACGTFVVEGEAEAVARATGAGTRLAGIAALTAAVTRGRSPLTAELAGVVRTVSVVAVAAGAALFGVGVALGLRPSEGFLLGLGVMVALVPEGLLPTVTLSLARAAQRMADRNALVRRLEAVETLGATTFICTDKTGTLTRNQMSVVRIWTAGGELVLPGRGYDPTEEVPAGRLGPAAAAVAGGAAACVSGRAVRRPDGRWAADGDPMEVALDVAARRLGAPGTGEAPVLRRLPYTADRRRSAVVVADPDQAAALHVLGAPEGVLAAVAGGGADPAARRVDELAALGLRVLAVARRTAPAGWESAPAADLERDLELVGLLALHDPPRDDVSGAVAACEDAGIRLAMVTGDHPGTAVAVAREVGLLAAGGRVVTAADLPADDDALAGLLDDPRGVVVARVGPEDKLRIAVALRRRGHVVAMTGDGVNDAPALRAADVGVAMGASGSDVAREAADLVLLDDHFATIVAAVELGRATFSNIRRFLTYHLSDNVAELAPFAAWALTSGNLPLALGVLQVLALDIGTDMLPALALGAEPANPRTLRGPVRQRRLVDGPLLGRAFGVLGATEAVGALSTFVVVLLLGGWRWAQVPEPALLATASGSAFAVIAVAQLVNAVACRSRVRPVWRTGLAGNRLLTAALAAELALLAAFLGAPGLSGLLGGSWPSVAGWAGAALTGAAVAAADGLHKRLTVPRRGPARRPLRAPRDGDPAPQPERRPSWS
jgi:magnesium-transporting ATPase (P-type)